MPGKLNLRHSLVLSLLLGAGLFSAVGWPCWICLHNPSIPFLSQSAPAAWIVFPKPLDARMHWQAALPAVFRRTFVLADARGPVALRVRAFRQAGVVINGQPVAGLELSGQDWKRERAAEVSRWLRAGTNEIQVTVTNSLGPPALWLVLETGGDPVRTDSSWEVSWAGSVWQAALPATEPPPIRPGNKLLGGERVGDSFQRTWPGLLAALAVCLVAIVFWSRASRVWARWSDVAARSRRRWVRPLGEPAVAFLVLVLVTWTLLLCNNLPRLSFLTGFDSEGHHQYIDYVLKKHALPLADEGWQMYQPPLFYGLSALAVGPFAQSVGSDRVILGLRFLCGFIGLVHLVVLFLCLRLLFPGKASLQITGLVFAAILPSHLCLAHHITNETLAALLATLTLYFCLRILRAPDGARSLRLLFGLGLALGLALLAKFSAVLLLPFGFGVLVWKRLVPGATLEEVPVFRELSATARKVQTPSASSAAPPKRPLLRRCGEVLWPAALVFVVVFAVCGWHYLRVWHRFGTPLIGNWDPRLPMAWWQEPGYRTAGWYFHFGHALASPLFSGVFGFWDSLYSTLWGDGFLSGSVRVAFRPPWNYDLMNAGYVLALFPTALLVIGAAVVLWRWLRGPTPQWSLLGGLAAAFGFGLVFMTLQVASFAQAKAFYALPALLPLSVLVLQGWDALTRRGTLVRRLAAVGLALWAGTTLSAFWIRPANPDIHLARGIACAEVDAYPEAIAEFDRCLELAPADLLAGIEKADTLAWSGHAEEACRQAEELIRQHPQSGEALAELGIARASAGQYEAALEPLRRARFLLPDQVSSSEHLVLALNGLDRLAEMQAACREALRVNPLNPRLHHLLLKALARSGDATNALDHARYAVELEPDRADGHVLYAACLAAVGRSQEAAAEYRVAIRHYEDVLAREPDRPDALNNLAWMLATCPDDQVRNGPKAVELARRACELTQSEQPFLLGTLAAAYAEAGRFPEAVETAQKARDLAAARGRADVARHNSELMELYRAGKACRESPLGQ